MSEKVLVDRELLKELVSSLEGEVESRYSNGIKDHPAMRRDYECDIEPVIRGKELLAAAPAAPEQVGNELDGLAGDLLVAADLVRNKAVSSRLVEYSRHVAKLAYCTPTPDAVLVEALREAVEYLDGNLLNQISSGSKLHCLMRAALNGKGGAQ